MRNVIVSNIEQSRILVEALLSLAFMSLHMHHMMYMQSVIIDPVT